jgi:regulator of ribosome biosynthesis
MDSSQIDQILSKNRNEVTSDELAQAAAVVELDVGHLMAFDPRPLDSTEIKKNKNEYIKDICTLNTQLLLNKLFNLPTERVEDVVIAKLPSGTTVFPREKPLPKEKPLTKWEQYAKLKGIKKTKKSRKVFDETSKEWRPRWGFKRANDTTKDWLIEIKKNQDPNQDFFAKRTEEKTERTAKNELQRLRNIARTSKKKVPGVGLTPTAVDEKNPNKFAVIIFIFAVKALFWFKFNFV